MLLAPRIEPIVRKNVEARLNNVFNADVHIDKIALEPRKGGIVLENLRVANPPSFKEGDAVHCDRVLVQPELASVFSAAPVISRIHLEGLNVLLRYEVGRGTNIGVLAHEATALAEADKETGAGREIVLKEVSSEAGHLKLASNLPLPPVPLTLEPFTIKNINENKPMVTAKVSAVLLRSLVTETLTVKGLLRPVLDLLQQELESP